MTLKDDITYLHSISKRIDERVHELEASEASWRKAFAELDEEVEKLRAVNVALKRRIQEQESKYKQQASYNLKTESGLG